MESNIETLLSAFRFEGGAGYQNKLLEIFEQNNTISEDDQKDILTIDSDSLLIRGATKNNLLMVERALDEVGVNVNTVCQDCKHTALIISCRNAYFKIFKLILKQNPDIELEDANWRSVWYFAFFGRELAQKNANKHIVDELLNYEKSLFRPTNNRKYYLPSSRSTLMACYAAQTPSVTKTMIGSLPMHILSKDSNLQCKVEVFGLEILDDPTVQMTWPDGSKTPHGETALHILVKKQMGHLLCEPVCLALLRWKWEKFGRRFFIVETIAFIVFLGLVSMLGVMHRPTSLSNPQKSLNEYEGTNDQVRLVMEFVAAIPLNTLLCTANLLDAGFLPKPVIRRILRLKSWEFVTKVQRKPFELLSLLPNFGLYVIAIMRCSKANETAQIRILSICSVGIWIRLIRYLSLLQSVGPYFIMLKVTLRKDVLPFGVVLFIFIPAFATGISLVVAHTHMNELDAVANFGEIWHTIIHLLQALAGGTEFVTLQSSWFELGTNDWTTTILYLCFLIAVPILSLNLLIAMMANTYSGINSNSIAAWSLQRGEFLMLREVLVTNPHFGFKRIDAATPKNWRLSRQVAREDAQTTNENAPTGSSGHRFKSNRRAVQKFVRYDFDEAEAEKGFRYQAPFDEVHHETTDTHLASVLKPGSDLTVLLCSQVQRLQAQVDRLLKAEGLNITEECETRNLLSKRASSYPTRSEKEKDDSCKLLDDVVESTKTEG